MKGRRDSRIAPEGFCCCRSNNTSGKPLLVSATFGIAGMPPESGLARQLHTVDPEVRRLDRCLPATYMWLPYSCSGRWIYPWAGACPLPSSRVINFLRRSSIIFMAPSNLASSKRNFSSAQSGGRLLPARSRFLNDSHLSRVFRSRFASSRNSGSPPPGAWTSLLMGFSNGRVYCGRSVPARAARELKATQSAYFTPWPPKISKADPMVRSTLPPPSRVTASRSASELAPPA